MTDEQIIKALPTVAYGGHSCNKCKYKYEKGECRCGLKGCRITRNALDLINRQNEQIEKLEKVEQFATKTIEKQEAEIERLQKAGDEAVSCFTRMESLYKIKCKELEVAKSEAIKEFAERLKEQLKRCIAYDGGLRRMIDTLVKEMTKRRKEDEEK